MTTRGQKPRQGVFAIFIATWAKGADPKHSPVRWAPQTGVLTEGDMRPVSSINGNVASRLSVGNSHNVRAGSNEARLSLDPSQDVEQPLPRSAVIKPRIQILVHPARPFDCDETVEPEAGVLHFGSDPLWAMKEGCR